MRLIALSWAAVAALLGGCLVAGCLVGGCLEPSVVRAVNGELVEGRYVTPYAYTLFAIGAEAEVRGDLRAALAAYERAGQDDPESPEIWTRVGSARCELGAGGAGEAFARAEALDPAYEPAVRARGRCALRRGRAAEALALADRAVVLDPDRDEGVLLRAEALEALGRREDALSALRALTIRRPRSAAGWRALSEVAARAGDDFTAAEARRRLEVVGGHGGVAPGSATEAAGRGERYARVDEALLSGDMKRARRLSLEAGLPAAEVAVRAAALGQAPEARAQAELVAGADPSSASAWIALAAAADLLGDEAEVARACDALWAGGSGREALVPPSSMARLLLAELLARRVGREAALAWLGGAGAGAAADADALERSLGKRVREQLATP